MSIRERGSGKGMGYFKEEVGKGKGVKVGSKVGKEVEIGSGSWNGQIIRQKGEGSAE